MALLIFVLWVIFNGRIALDVVISGVVISAVVTWFAKRFCNWSITKSWKWKKVLPGLIGYFFLLVREITLANLAVIRIILNPKMEEKVKPQLARFPVEFRSDFTRMLLANSITLTPGTITVSLRDKFFIIHALTPELAATQDMAFVKACRKLDEAMKPEKEAQENV